MFSARPYLKLYPKKVPDRDAFTMVELLIGVAIIAILALLIFDGLNSLIARAQGSACAANMRKVGGALLTYRSEHNGWFPPGYPKHPTEALNFNKVLVPQYLTELPICPGAKKKLTPAEKKAYGSDKVWYQRNHGTYAINEVLTQWRLEAMPWPASGWGDGSAYSGPAHLPLLLETRHGTSSSWSFIHQNHVIQGQESTGIAPRSHGKGDSLNFMFVDGHIEMISRNDPRNVEEAQKNWEFPTNPNGQFQTFGKNGRHIRHNQIGNDRFDALYPDMSEK